MVCISSQKICQREKRETCRVVFNLRHLPLWAAGVERERAGADILPLRRRAADHRTRSDWRRQMIVSLDLRSTSSNVRSRDNIRRSLRALCGREVPVRWRGEAWRDIKAWIVALPPEIDALQLPSVSEPFLAWVISGEVDFHYLGEKLRKIPVSLSLPFAAEAIIEGP